MKIFYQPVLSKNNKNKIWQKSKHMVCFAVSFKTADHHSKYHYKCYPVSLSLGYIVLFFIAVTGMSYFRFTGEGHWTLCLTSI